MEEGSSGGATGVSPDAEAVMARFSLDVSAGCGGRHSTLLDEYERLAFEAQLNRAIVLRRCYSEPSPVRFADASRPALPAGAGRQGEAAEAPPRHEQAAAGRLFWRLHEAMVRLMQALEPVLRWLRSVWERQRRTEQTAVPPRVQLRDYLR